MSASQRDTNIGEQKDRLPVNNEPSWKLMLNGLQPHMAVVASQLRRETRRLPQDPAGPADRHIGPGDPSLVQNGVISTSGMRGPALFHAYVERRGC